MRYLRRRERGWKGWKEKNTGQRLSGDRDQGAHSRGIILAVSRVEARDFSLAAKLPLKGSTRDGAQRSEDRANVCAPASPAKFRVGSTFPFWGKAGYGQRPWVGARGSGRHELRGTDRPVAAWRVFWWALVGCPPLRRPLVQRQGCSFQSCSEAAKKPEGMSTKDGSQSSGVLVVPGVSLTRFYRATARFLVLIF